MADPTIPQNASPSLFVVTVYEPGLKLVEAPRDLQFSIESLIRMRLKERRQAPAREPYSQRKLKSGLCRYGWIRSRTIF